MDLMELPLWAWIVFYVLVFIMLIADLKMLLAMNEYVNAPLRFVGIQANIPHVEVPTPVSLAVIFGLLVVSMLLSVVVTKREKELADMH